MQDQDTNKADFFKRAPRHELRRGAIFLIITTRKYA
jgi:hypothetical protein